jgi:hypothetical protein
MSADYPNPVAGGDTVGKADLSSTSERQWSTDNGTIYSNWSAIAWLFFSVNNIGDYSKIYI